MSIKVFTDVKFLSKHESDVLEITYSSIAIKDVIFGIRRFYFYDVTILNALGSVTFLILLLKMIGIYRSRVIILDPIFVKPEGLKQQLIAYIKGFLINSADALLIYAKNNEGVRKHFRVKNEIMHYVPFKVNGLDLIVEKFSNKENKGYVFSGGRSRRDYALLITVAAELPAIQFKIVCPANEKLAEENCSIYQGALPANVEIINDNGTLDEFLDVMSQSDMVVLPTTTDNIAPAGISVYLNAMAVKKPVIISKGPAVDGVISADQAIMVEAGKKAELKSAIEDLFHDAGRKHSLAMNGYNYAMSLGDESELFKSVEKFIAKSVA